MRFVSANDTKVIQADWWDEGEQVTIRKFSISQRDALNERIISITGASAENDVTQMQIKAAQVPVLEAGIKGWTFRNEDGKRVLSSPDNLGRLQPRDADFIAAEIWAFNRREEEDLESFPDEGEADSAGEE